MTGAKRCPDCRGPISIIRAKLPHVSVVHEPSCPQWLKRAAEHGIGAGDVLVHNDDKVHITETSRRSS